MRMPSVNYDVIRMKGGMDEITPILSTPKGFARKSVNYESSVLSGYTRIMGYERYSGQPAPSDAIAYVLFIDAFVNVPAVGDSINGVTSLATGVVAYVTTDYIVYTKLVGTFLAGESIHSGALTIGNNSAASSPISAEQKAFNLSTAADIYRADISTVPGSGPCQGGFIYNDTVYAFRANLAGTLTLLYKDSPTGWVNVPFYREVRFSAGGAIPPQDGDILTQGATTSVIKRVILETGTWLSGSATGRLVIATGGFIAGAATSGAVTFTLDSPDTAITMLPGGKIESEINTFTGGALDSRVYGADGVNRAFEFDGDTLAPIETKSTIDAPKHIHIHENMLFLSIKEQLIYSAPGLPYNYTALSFSGSYATRYDITGLQTMPGDQTSAAMMVTSRANEGVYMLYGKGQTSFVFTPFLSGGGAFDYTIQNMSQTYMFDDRGIIGLQTTLNYGNFEAISLSYHVNKFVNLHKNLVSCSILDRKKSQYRLFFSDGNGLYMTVLNGQLHGIMPVQFPHHIFNVISGRFSNGDDGAFLCTNDGYVMQMEKGTSFDGADINAKLEMVYDQTGSSRIIKRYRKCALEVEGDLFAKIGFGYKLGYNKSNISQPSNKDYQSSVDPVQWDHFTWDAFRWDGKDISPLEVEMGGSAENVSLVFSSGTNYISSYSINTATIHYTARRGIR